MTKKKNKTIAVVIDPDWPIKSHHEVIGGIEDYAEKRKGWDLVNDLFPEAAIERYDGVIGRITEDVARETKKMGIPVVNTWMASPVKDLPSVFPDFGATARLAADHLIARGFNSFGSIGFAFPADRIAHEAFKSHLRKSRYNSKSILLSDRYNTNRNAWIRFNRRLENWLESLAFPVGIFSSKDLLCRQVVTVCKIRKIRIPDEVALVGVHNEPGWCLLSAPTLSSIDTGFDQVGFQAAQLLDELMQGGKPPDQPILIPPAFLVVRQSSDAFATKDSVVAEALAFIAKHSHEAIKVNDVAEAVNQGRRALERRFLNEKFGLTILEAIDHFKVERLKRLLVQSEMTIKDLAFDSGFSDPNRMSTWFRRITGCSPTEYRRQHGKDGQINRE